MNIQKLYFHISFVTVFLTTGVIPLAAQADAEAVKKPILALFDGMRTSDTVLMKSAFAPAAQLQTITKNKTGETMVQSANLANFVASVAKPHAAPYDERITFETIKVDGDLATVWTPYKFYVGETFSHYGVNSFQLVRWNGEWKIQYVIDTRKKEGCL